MDDGGILIVGAATPVILNSTFSGSSIQPLLIHVSRTMHVNDDMMTFA